MPFTPEQEKSLLAEKGIGKTIIQRLAQMGLDDIPALAEADVDDILAHGAYLTAPAGETARKPAPPSQLPSPGRSGKKRAVDSPDAIPLTSTP